MTEKEIEQDDLPETAQEITDLKLIRNYFGTHDITPFEHAAYLIIDKIIENASKQEPEKLFERMGKIFNPNS